jgi:hypothetical protein
MSFNEIYKQSVESNNILLQKNEANALQELNNKRNKVIIRTVQEITPPRKIKYLYTTSDSQSFLRRPSQKPNSMFEKKIDVIKVDTPQLSDIHITNVQKVENSDTPRTFESVFEKNILNMPPVFEKEFNPKIIRFFDKIGKNNELNFIEVKSTHKIIDVPILPTISNKTILKRL